ncbi:FtsK/SpoIIIE domain-containing protein [Frigoribacterium sp. ACAM 257]|uniref:FtsK/SpoIIIE domain-containing protein n=1 Tax=Frigoribacterium sp. ACAM 257 TaxID=2508998 RepID=UPI001CB88B33|nr:FtsK/SpoIIIE domain-containing protein [Frigoribacterium sp. ACAM 257]
MAWEVDPGTTVGQLVTAALPHLGLATIADREAPGQRAVTVDGSLVALDACVAAGHVLEASVLSIGAPHGTSSLPDDGPSVRVVGGPGAGTVFVVDPGACIIGSSHRATIRLVGDVPAFVAVLRLDGGGRFTIEPASACAPDGLGGDLVVTVDRRPLVEAVPLGESSIVRIGDVLLAVAAGRRPGAALHVATSGTRLEFARPPRLLPEAPPTSFRLPPEPEAPARRPLPVVAALAPLAMAGVMVGIFGHLMYLAFGLMSPIVMIANYVSDRRNGRLTHRRRLAEHEAATTSVLTAADDAVHRHEQELRASCPDPAAVLDTAVRRRARLWERRRADPDHLALRVGTADHPSGVTIDDPRELEHLRTVAREAHAVPVTVDLPRCGVVGIAGRDEHARPLAAWWLAQIGVLQSPRDVEVVLLTSGSGEEHWSWLRWLPHTRPGEPTTCSSRVGHDAEGIARRLAELTALIAARRRAAREPRGAVDVDAPDVVVVVDGARRLRSLPGLVTVLKEGPSVRVWAICLDVDERSLPEECVAVVSAEAHRHRVAAQRTASVQEVLADELPEGWHEAVARAVAPVVEIDHGGEAGGLPSSSRLLDLLGLDEPDGAAVLDRWRRLGPSTRVVLGESIDGPFAVDLRADGPHALVAGTTGSGKSELLQSLVASLAATNDTDAVTFVLVDYKGGAAFRDFAALPHTVGTVTDLDGHLVERALTSLRAELHRRELILAEAGAKDIEDHADQVARGQLATALPRLVIVIDEFASLVRELPDFVTGLVDIAQRGRSLGIHLVLATQRPTGVVSADIRANTALRIALRVTDPAESTDVIDAPDASAISPTTPGRAFVRLGAGALLPFQAGRVGGRPPGAVVTRTGPVWSSRLEWSTIGSIPRLPPEVERADDGELTDLALLVGAAVAAHQLGGGSAPHRPWLDALPEVVLLDELPEAPGTVQAGRSDDTRVGAAERAVLPFGLRDLPARQAQAPAVLDLDAAGHLFVVGSPRSGRSQVLRALAASAADRTSCSDVHLYGIDCGSGALLPLTALPHTGAVVQRSEVDRVRRLLTRLVSETLRRQDELARRGHGGIVEQRRASAPADRMPHVVLMIDRWEGFTASIGELDHGEPVEQVTFLLREGPGVGVHLVVTGDRQLITGRLATMVEDKLVLRLADRSDYGLVGLSPRALPEKIGDGRGFTSETAVETQVALLCGDPAASAQAESLRVRGSSATERDRTVPAARRPFRLERLDGPVGFADAWARRSPGITADAMVAMVGLGGDDMGVVGPDLAAGAGTFLVAGPGRSGRSTVLLSMARSLLAQDVELVVVAPRASPLRELEAVPGVLSVLATAAVSAADLAPWFDGGQRRRVLVVDDAETIKDCPAAAWLVDFIASCGERGQGLVAGGSSSELALGFTGWHVDLRRGRCGALLSPQVPAEGDLIGAVVPRSSLSVRPRVGVAQVNVGDGVVQLAQVPSP